MSMNWANSDALDHRECNPWIQGYSDCGGSTSNYKLKCEAEVVRLKNHMLTDTMSLQNVLAAD